MSEMIDRVAGAIMGASHSDYRIMARAAIAAMREPTEVMLRAFYGDMPVESRLGDDWRDMIDAALKD